MILIMIIINTNNENEGNSSDGKGSDLIFVNKIPEPQFLKFCSINYMKLLIKNRKII